MVGREGVSRPGPPPYVNDTDTAAAVGHRVLVAAPGHSAAARAREVVGAERTRERSCR